MINITDKSSCCGCTACVSICPVQCIVMRRDRKEGFDYPVANPDICIGCGKCDSVCPMQNPAAPKKPLSVYAALSDKYRKGSTSGGVFPLIAESVLADGGIVYGASMNDDMVVEHIEADTTDGLDRIRGSKYVQSELYSAFEDIKGYLSDGRKVLFSGTPCQVAGLNSYLGGKSENLVTVDMACHGVPGPGLWEKYVAALEHKYGAKVTRTEFRDKSRSWRHYDFKICLSHEDGQTVCHSTPFIKDPYMALFIQNMTLRPSCYSCKAKNGRSGSDLTLADFWGVCEVMPEVDDDKGISLILANTEKGLDIIRNNSSILKEVDADVIEIRNSGFKENIPIPERRDEFFSGLHSVKDVHEYMSGFVVRKSWLDKRISGFKRIISKITGGKR